MNSLFRRASFPAAALSLGLALNAAPAAADVSLPSVLGSHMVLQRHVEVPVWGWAAPGERVTVEFAGQKRSTRAGADGNWSVRLKPMKASSTGRALTVKGVNTLTLDDVLVGEVWLCSGQSNMEWSVQASDRAAEEIAAGNHPRIRHIKIPHVPAAHPEKNVPSEGWKVSTPQTVAPFTAVGYYFARHLVKELDVPVGLIGSNWGGTRIEPWTPPIGFEQVPALADITRDIYKYPTRVAQPNPASPLRPRMVVNHQSPLALYNGMIHPLVPYAFRGALWYQGESNNGEGMLYYEKMKALIEGWRTVWANPEMPFYFVQLAPYRYGGDPERLAAIWEAQEAALGLPHTGMAVTTDIGNVADIHPRNKQEVGRRLALWALAKTYGQGDLVYSGPLYKGKTVRGNTIRLRFKHAAGGLKSRDGKALTHFTIAGADKKFVPAEARIEGSTVVVSSAQVPNPTAVRFAWHQEAEPNLANAAGLPASPFRTDRP